MCCFQKKGIGKQHAGSEDLDAPEPKSQVPYLKEEHAEAQRLTMGLRLDHMASLT